MVEACLIANVALPERSHSTWPEAMRQVSKIAPSARPKGR